MDALIIQTIGTVASMIVIGLITVFIARKSGLSDLQASARAETTLLINTQKERITMLEEKIEELIGRVKHLEEEGKRDKREIAKLKKIITDNAIATLGGDS